MTFMMGYAFYFDIHCSAEQIPVVHVQDRSFDTITMNQYDRLVDFVYRYAKDDDFATQYALSECILNDIEANHSQNKIGVYIDKLYDKYETRLIKSDFDKETEDTKDAIREAVQSALDERTMPSGVSAFYKIGELYKPSDRYAKNYLDDSSIVFCYEN